MRSAESAVQAIKDIHERGLLDDWYGQPIVGCKTCSVPWPCDTARVLEDVTAEPVPQYEVAASVLARRARKSEKTLWQHLAMLSERVGTTLAELASEGSTLDVENALLETATSALATVEHLRGCDEQSLRVLAERVVRGENDG